MMKCPVVALLVAVSMFPAMAISKTFTFEGAFEGTVDFHGEVGHASYKLSGEFEAEDANSDGLFETSEISAISAHTSIFLEAINIFPLLSINLRTTSLNTLRELTYSGQGFLDQLDFYGTRTCTFSSPGPSSETQEYLGSFEYSSVSQSTGNFSASQQTFFRGTGTHYCGEFNNAVGLSGTFPVTVSLAASETAAVPLPASLPLFLTVFGGLGLVLRRRVF